MVTFRHFDAVIRRSARTILVLGTATSALLALPPREAVANPPEPESRFQSLVEQANSILYRWQSDEETFFKTYLPRRGLSDGPNEDIDLQIDTQKFGSRAYSPSETLRDLSTAQLVQRYYGHQGLNRYHGVFIESGSAHTGEHQWNTLKSIGFGVKALRNQFLDQLVATGTFNLRIGINVHELDLKNPRTLDAILDLHREAWKRGISITDSIFFFPGLKNLEVMENGHVDFSRSYHNSPLLADYAEKVTDFVFTALFKEQAKFNAQNESLPLQQQKPKARIAVNKSNESETHIAFASLQKNGYPSWSDPNIDALYVPGIINLAKATVRMHKAVLRASGGERVLFFHNEAMTPDNYPSHRGNFQFAVSKFILGDDQLLKADFNALAAEDLQQMKARFEKNKRAGRINVVEASILGYSLIPQNDSPEKIETARQKVVAMLRDLQNEHLDLQRSMHVTAKTDTILMLDYYQQSEFELPQSVPELIRELSAHHGEKLKAALHAETDEGFMNVLRERARESEAATGQKIWLDFPNRASIDFEKLLSQEDGILVDKVIGLRNNWQLDHDAEFVRRRQSAGFDEAELPRTDEKRIDTFLNRLVADDGAVLKKALNVQSDAQLFEVLRAIGQDSSRGGPTVSIVSGERLRDILNASERTILHRAFGLRRERLVGFLPPHYARQTRAKLRKGFAELFSRYVNELGLRVAGIGESGTPYFPWASGVAKQMMFSLVKVAKRLGLLVVRCDIGPGVGAIGWMNGPMTGDLRTNGKRGEDGVFKLVRKNPRDFTYELSAWPGSQPWFKMFLDDFRGGLSKAQSEVENERQRPDKIQVLRRERPKSCQFLFQ